MNRELLESRSGGLMYHLIDTPGFEDMHKTRDRKIAQEFLRRLSQVNGLMVLERLQHSLELTRTIPRSLAVDANAQGTIESFWNQLMGVAKALKRLHRAKSDLIQDPHR